MVEYHFEETANQIAEQNAGLVMFSVISDGYRDFAMNFWRTSIESFGLEKMSMFVATDYSLFEYFDHQGIPSAFVGEAPSHKTQIHPSVINPSQLDHSSNGANFGSSKFKKIVNVKGELTLKLLKMGYSVFLSDVDIVFLKNPLMEMESLLSENNEYDIIIQTDASSFGNYKNTYNSGFYIVQPTKAGIALFEKTVRNEKLGMRNQPALISAMKRTPNINIHVLHPDQFPNGMFYFMHRSNPWPQKTHSHHRSVPAIIHNNWIYTHSAKRYRFKELGLWEVEDDSYYNDPSRKYVTLRFPNNFEFKHSDRKQILEEQRHAIKQALAISYILNRTLILPKLSCIGPPPIRETAFCMFSTYYAIKTLDDTYSIHPYREHHFLYDKRVPPEQRNNHQTVFQFLLPNTTDFMEIPKTKINWDQVRIDPPEYIYPISIEDFSPFTIHNQDSKGRLKISPKMIRYLFDNNGRFSHLTLLEFVDLTRINIDLSRYPGIAESIEKSIKNCGWKQSCVVSKSFLGF